MYDGYLSFGGVEIFNLQRVTAYLKAFAPKIELNPDLVPTGLNTALGHGAYVSPQADAAPWWRNTRPATSRFYGLLPSKVRGAEDSTREVEKTDLAGDGAIHTRSRHGSREILVKASAWAADEEAMSEGIAWLREVLAADACGTGGGLGCTGHQISMFTAKPSTTVEANNLRRTYYKAQTLEGPLVKKETHVQSLVMWEIEFTLEAGWPWAFTNNTLLTTLDLPSGASYTDPVGENCSAMDDPYLDFIDDPYFTGIAKPPAPSTILPPNLIDISTWRRRTYNIDAVQTDRWGRIVPLVRLTSGGVAVQHMRIRFYQGTTVSGCDYDGEFYVSYLPANAVMVIDGMKKEIFVTLSDGRRVPGGHLIFGSDGRPFMWPSLGCQQSYTMTADIMPGQTGMTLQLETAVRE